MHVCDAGLLNTHSSYVRAIYITPLAQVKPSDNSKPYTLSLYHGNGWYFYLQCAGLHAIIRFMNNHPKWHNHTSLHNYQITFYFQFSVHERWLSPTPCALFLFCSPSDCLVGWAWFCLNNSGIDLWEYSNLCGVSGVCIHYSTVSAVR